MPVLVDAAQLALHRPLPVAGRLRGLQRRQALRALRGWGADRAPATFSDGRPVPRRRGCRRPGRPGRGHLERAPDREEAGSPNVVGASRPARPPWPSSAASAGTPSWPTSRAGPAGSPPAWRRSTGCACSGRGTGGGRRHPAGRPLHPRGDAPRAGGGPAQCRVRDRRAPRVLLRPPLLPAPAGHGPAAVAPPGEVLPRQPPQHPRGGAGQLRAWARPRPTSTRCWPAVAELAAGGPRPVPYEQDATTGDFFPVRRSRARRGTPPAELGAGLLTGMTGTSSRPTYDHPVHRGRDRHDQRGPMSTEQQRPRWSGTVSLVVLRRRRPGRLHEVDGHADGRGRAGRLCGRGRHGIEPRGTGCPRRHRHRRRRAVDRRGARCPAAVALVPGGRFVAGRRQVGRPARRGLRRPAARSRGRWESGSNPTP